MLQNLKKYLLVPVMLIVLAFALYAYAKNNTLTVVYPKNGATITANTTFFVGNTNPDALLTINNDKVKVFSTGSFVHVFRLQKGKNIIEIKSSLNDDVKIEKYVLNVQTSKELTKSDKPEFIPKKEIIEVTEAEAPLRKTPYGDRLTPVKKSMVAESVGIFNNHYKVKYMDGYAYILKSFANAIGKEKTSFQIAKKIYFANDSKYIYVKIPLEQPVLSKISHSNNEITVGLSDVTFDFESTYYQIPEIKDFYYDEHYFKISLASNKLNGYDYFYDANNFVLKIRKPFTKTLQDKIIAIDAGHGGREFGSVGPTCIPEKDINLQISKYLKKELEKLGATVIMTRTGDDSVDLYKRVELAQAENADIFVSIHNNALPDGLNPYIIHGTTTYFYHPQGAILAQYVQDELVKKTGFKNLGIKYSSFVVTRPTNPVSILVEVGYMIYPYEYEQLILSDMQKQYAIGIKNGIVEYFKN